MTVLNPHIFRAYDVRGVVERDLVPEVVRALGRAHGTRVVRDGGRRVVVGRDVRTHSERLAADLAAGLAGCGLEVVDVGVVPTPVLYFAVHHLDADGGVMITGSHNPPEFNGFKLLAGKEAIHGEAIADLRRRIEAGDFEQGEGARAEEDVVPAYQAAVVERIRPPGRGLPVVVDAGNGTAGPVAAPLYRALGHTVEELYCRPDGTFPHHHPDPSLPENVAPLAERVRQLGAHLGLAFDGDSDRLGVVDHEGRTIAADRLLACQGVATLALVANLSPYGRTDAWHLAGMLTRIPSLRRRALHFLVRQVGRNLRKRAPTTPDERRYLLLVTLWLLHALLVLALVGERLLPGATGLLGATISGTGVAHFEASLVVTGLLVGVVAVAGALYAAALAGLVGAFLVQLLRTRPPVVRRGDAGEAETRAFLAGADGVPFLAGLDATARGMVAFALRREAHPPESAVITQGTVGDRFCFLLSGHCRVEVCEASGIVHDVAHLGPGAFFGEVALLEGRPRTATVRAMDEVVVLTLEREAFDHILDESDLPRDRCVEDLRVAALLREIPPLRELSPPELDQLQRGLVSEARGAGEVILREGDPGDAMYLLREGRCRVIRDGDLLAELGPGDYFGELALIATGSRTASVVAANDVSLLRLPAELFHSVLLANFEAALRLDEGCADRLDALQGR